MGGNSGNLLYVVTFGMMLETPNRESKSEYNHKSKSVARNQNSLVSPPPPPISKLGVSFVMMVGLSQNFPPTLKWGDRGEGTYLRAYI